MDLNFEALNQGAAAIPAAVRASTDAYGSLLQNAKVSDAMVKANPDLPQRMGMTPEQYQSMSAQNRIAATTGYMKNQGAQEMLARIAGEQASAREATARAGYFQSFGAERQAQAQAQIQDDQASAQYAQALDQQISNPDPNNPDAVAFAKSVPVGVKFQIHAAAQAGRSNPRVGAALVRPLMNYFSGPGGQGGAATTPAPIKDDQGNVLATPAPDGKGGFKWIKSGKTTPSTVKITDNSDPSNPVTIELPLDEAEKRGYIKAPPSSGAASTPTPKPDAGAAAPDPADIKWLTDNPDPDHVAAFEAKYGAGAAGQYTNPNPSATTAPAAQ